MKKSAIAGISVVALGATLAASAAGMQDQSGRFHRRAAGIIVHRIESQLNITGEQRAHIKAIVATEKPVIQALAARVQTQNEDLQQHTSFNESEIRTFAQQHESTMEDVLVEREKVRIEVLQVLTPAQQAKLHQFRAARSADFAERLTTLGDLI